MASDSKDAGTVGSSHELLHKLKAELDMPVYGTSLMTEDIDRSRFPERPMPARAVQRLIRHRRLLDANPTLNLASFVTTYMEPECEELMMEAINVNYIDQSEYPSTTDIHNDCVKMLADLYHADDVCGTGTVGSSEAVLLAGIALKRRWSEAKRSTGRPNMVCTTTVHVVWEKLFNYLEIEPRYVPITPERLVGDPQEIADMCDENTIGVVAILGTTYSGHFEDVEALDAAIDKVNQKNGWEIGIHVDGASGAFVAPFIFPDFKFDFRLKNVVSINVSGHKFGLTYCGIGWCIFRGKKYLPQSLIFHEAYLGKDQENFTLNFSKGASQIVGQFYQFLRLGRAGYTAIISNCWVVANYLADKIGNMPFFLVVSARDPAPGVPLVTFTLRPEYREGHKDEFLIAEHLRQRGWIVPAYKMARGAEDMLVLRVLCREDFSKRGAHDFLDDLERTMQWFQIQDPGQAEVLRREMKWRALPTRVAKRTTSKDLDALPSLHLIDKYHGGIC